MFQNSNFVSSKSSRIGVNPIELKFWENEFTQHTVYFKVKNFISRIKQFYHKTMTFTYYSIEEVLIWFYIYDTGEYLNVIIHANGPL